MKIRLANPEDRDLFLGLARDKPYPSSPVTGVTGEQRRESNLRDYDGQWKENQRRPDIKILLAERGGRPVGFLVLNLNQKSGLTGEPQVRIIDHGGPAEAYPDLLDAAVALGRLSGNRYITTRVYVSCPSERVLFESLGFKGELTRVVKRADDEDFSGPYRLRLADPSDRLFMAMVNAKSTNFYLYAHRTDNAEQVASRNFAHYLNLDLTQPEKFMGIIVEDQEGPVGYVLLQHYWEMDVSQASGSYVYDVAIDPRCHGSRASLQIARFGLCQIKRLGREFAFGDVSLDNPRTLKWARLGLGYSADWERWGRPIGPWELVRPKVKQS